MRHVGAGMALPFAAIGDTLLLPVQGLGGASDELLQLGEEHRARMHAENRGKITEDAAAASAIVYELPGYLLYPFSLVSPPKLYPMTSACWDALRPAETNAPAAVPASTPAISDTFEEW